MKLATRTTRIVPSPTLNITATAKAMAAQGLDMIEFAAGEPACDTPEFVKEAAHRAIREGFTKYTPVPGTDDLRSAIIDKFQRDQGARYEKSQILVSCGAKHTLYNLGQALLEEGDEVIIPVPYWVSYPDQVRLADATPVFLETRESEDYAIDPNALEACITPRTKALILNSPCNPSGAVLTGKTLEAVAEVLLRHDILVISDEIYEQLVYGEPPFLSIITVAPELARKAVLVNGVSKSFSMTGWRIGYAAGPKELIAAMTNIQSQSTSNPTSIAQRAATAALRGDGAFFESLRADLAPKRTLMVDRLNAIPGITCPLPAGAFYAFANVSGLLGRHSEQGPISSAADLATYLLHEAHIACIPGEPFGSAKHLRFSYTPTPDTIAKGMDRLEAAIQSLRKN